MSEDLKAMELRLLAEAEAAAVAAEAKRRELEEFQTLKTLAAKFKVDLSQLSPEPVSEQPAPSSETLDWLIHQFFTHEDSPFATAGHQTKRNYSNMLRRLRKEYGDVRLSEITEETLRDWHKGWVGTDNHHTVGRSLLGMVRGLVNFGGTTLKDPVYPPLRLAVHDLLHELRVHKSKPRVEVMTVEHANAIRAAAHKLRVPSIALAQAIQCGTPLRQKDLIGEWVPISEPGTPSDIIHGKTKWLRGLRWNDIGENLIVRHNKIGDIDLRAAPMVMEELTARFCKRGEPLTRSKLPTTGAVIVFERSREPYRDYQFRREWRRVRRAAGVPEGVFNMDSAITSAKAEAAKARREARKSTGIPAASRP